MRYVRYADDVRSRNSVKTQQCTKEGRKEGRSAERRRCGNNNSPSKNTIENRDDDDDEDDNRWEAGDKEVEANRQ